MKRRNFIQNSISFSALIALHYNAQSESEKIKGNLNSKPNRFPEITLYSAQLDKQLDFYKNKMGFPIIGSQPKEFTVQIGGTILRFRRAEKGTSPFYHYAINIPSNKYKLAKKWLEKRTPLLKNGNSDQVLLYFDFWDAHAMYFRDPDGNIGEFIARHTLKNNRDGEFGVADLLCISEIGTPVNDPEDMGAALKKAYQLETFGGSMFIGDENGLFVIPPIDRYWFPDYKQKAEAHPVDIVIAEKGMQEYQYQEYPYFIKQRL